MLDMPAPLADGVRVEVRAAKAANGKALRSAKGSARKKPNSLVKLLLRYAGTVKDMPSDLSRNHDHYLYGVPKKKR